MITAVFNTQFDQARLEPLATNDFLAVPAADGARLRALALQHVGCVHRRDDVEFLVCREAGVPGLDSMMDVKLIFMYSAVFRRRFVAALVIGVFALVALLCLLWANVAPIPTYGR
ncbi:MAG: hypothetical protein R3F11_05600 [Verrucomicrobiales bacterium]